MPARRSKVVFVIDHFIPWKAGTEHQLSMLMPGLPDNWEVEVVVFRPSEALDRHAAALGVTHRTITIDNFRSMRCYANIARLVSHLRSVKPDVVHSFFPVANIVGVLAAKLAGVPRIYSSRRDFGEWMSPRYLQATRFANRFVSGVVTNSGRVKQLTVDVEGVPEKDVHVIANGIDVDRFAALPERSACRATLGLGDDAVVAGLVANFRPMKRQDSLIRALAHLKDEYPQFRVVLVGINATDEDLRQRAMDLAEELCVRDRVVFTHSDDDIRQLLTCFDIGVNCSEGEGLSNAIMEYMAAGLACVVSDGGGNPDLIGDGETGLVFSRGDDAELAAKLKQLLDSPSEREVFGKRARQQVVERYSIGTMTAEFVALYESA
ncbi:MAG: glycosyltransferase [Pseudomonadota bacterium]